MSRLLVLGCGYTVSHAVARLRGRFESVDATVRSAGKAARLTAEGVSAHVMDGAGTPSAALADAVAAATHLLVSIPPDAAGDPALRVLGTALHRARHLGWIGYLSSTAVYGDTGGRLIDETAQTDPTSGRGRRRIAAEAAWHDTATRLGAALQIFRLAGIYGPGRNALLDVAAGRARRIDRPGQMFNRIHVADIAGALAAGMARPQAGPVFNLADDEAAPAHEVVRFACDLLGVAPPPLVPFADAAADLSPTALGFWAENRRVSNHAMRALLAGPPRYPTYREGLTALHRAGEGARPHAAGSPPDG